MRRCLAFAITGLLLAMLPSRAAAWNSVGHLATAKLAYDQLGDGDKLKLYEILKHHPHFDMFLAVGRPDGVDEAEWVILRSAIWPDWVRPRGDKDPRGSAVTKFHRGEDHYINIPLIDPKDTETLAGKTLVNPDTMNIVAALKQRCNELHAKNVAIEDKAVAICWIFHLIGDIHQPMHAVAYFSSAPAFKDGDQGGNKFGIKVDGRGVKLHAYWDDLLGADPKYADDSGDRQARIYKMAVEAATGLRGRELVDADKEKLDKNQTFASWSQESFELAKSVAYRKTDGTGLLDAVEVRFNQPVPDAAPEVGEQYAKTAKATAEVRVIMAGRRLAERLKLVLGK
jgi:S1/P1 Nuclease